ncbi:hypothetical protein C8Q73DRAFT_793613 [Cubamyces lactineus]|nr:hypothetical protein C8Q73DRAFT_793613 [Cubamyces lactineus]
MSDPSGSSAGIPRATRLPFAPPPRLPSPDRIREPHVDPPSSSTRENESRATSASTTTSGALPAPTQPFSPNDASPIGKRSYYHSQSFASVQKPLARERQRIARLSMTGKAIIVQYDEFMKWFVPAPFGVEEPTAQLKALDFSAVATKPESNMYPSLVAALNHDWLLPEDKAISNASTADPNSKNKQVVDAGIYRRSDAPGVGKKTRWGYMELPIECKTEEVKQDPFDQKNSSGNYEPQSDIRKAILGQIMCYSVLIFDNQRRMHHFMLIMFGKNARILRWDRSGVVVTEPFDYVENPDMLGLFIWRFGRMSPEQRGHDPTATRISADSEQFRLMVERAVNPAVKVANEKQDDADDEEGTTSEGENRANIEEGDPNDDDSIPELADVEPVDGSDWETEDSEEASQHTGEDIDCEIHEAGAGEDVETTGIPGDHARAGFANSLKEGAICWRLRVDDVEKGPRYFLVGRPHFIASGLAGRGTQTFIAIDEADPQGPFVYVKDAWRVAHVGIEQEGKILERLNSDEDGGPVPFVPTVRCHGDVEKQITRSQEIWRLKNPGRSEECPLKTHRHYRLVVNEVGIPMSKFTNMQELVGLFSMIIDTHGEAYNRKKLIHRDISAGNVLIYPKVTVGENGELEEDRLPLLADWELAKRVDEPDEKPRQPDRTGTWQFMSANALRHPHKRILVQDDIESLFHLLLYYAVRFLPNNLSDVGRFMDLYFDGYEDYNGVTYGGEKKLVTMRLGKLTVPVGDLPLRFYLLPAKRTGKHKTSPSTSKHEKLPTSCSPSTLAACDVVSSPGSPKPSDLQKEKPLPRKPHPINKLFGDFLQRLSAYYKLYVPEDTDLPSERKSKASRPMKKMPQARTKGRKTLHARMEARKQKAVLEHPSAGNAATEQLTPERREELEVLAASVADHVKLSQLFTAYYWRSDWPTHDRCPDQLPANYRPKNERGLITIDTGMKRSADSTFEASGRDTKRGRSSSGGP